MKLARKREEIKRGGVGGVGGVEVLTMFMTWRG